MRKLKYLVAGLLVSFLFITAGCSDDFADINSNPSQIVKADVSYLFSQSVIEFEPSGYLLWYYNAPMTFNWSQMGVPTGGFNANYILSTATGDQGLQYIRVLRYVRDIANVRSGMSADEAAKYANIAACADVLLVYLGIFDTDMYGDIPFTEAAMARYGGTLTPKYDKVADLYTLWLQTLDGSINTLTTSSDQIFPSRQDVVYKGEASKWAKLANSLKLKIAARLISQDRPRALAIASAVASSSAGVLDGQADDFVFNKASAITSDDGDKVYHWSNGFLDATASSQRVVDFMLKNQDPRVRFFFRKNSWNSKIVQAFFDQDKSIPAYVLDNVDYTTDGDGKKTFVAWKGLGEPWVRYYGLPVQMEAGLNPIVYGDYFDYSTRFKLKIGDAEKTYTPFSMFQQEMIIGRYDFTLPTVPGGPVIQDLDDAPWYGMYMSTAEVNLYLAEFKLLGASLPKTAAEYFNKAVAASVTEYDRLANLNKIPYYSRTYDYDSNEKVIALQNGEIAEMASNADYQLTGDVALDLEKVYLQQLIHFTLYPSDQFVTARRSGCPKFGSTLINREDHAPSVANNAIPRRFEVGVPSPTDLMYKNTMDAYASQGFTPGSAQAGTLLNSERVWQDINAPQFGEGPKN